MGRGLSTDFGAQAAPVYSTLAPTLTAEATNPQGFSPEDLAAKNTASQQSVGGATAGVVGQGNLAAARTRNAGAFAPALDEGAREGGRTLSTNALKIQSDNADLREKNRQSGIQGLQSLYGGLTDDQLKALGLSSSSFSQASQAYVNPTVGLLQSAMSGAGQAATGSIGGCWIADVLFGVGSEKANTLRFWLNNIFKFKWYGKHITQLYLRFGERIADFLKDKPVAQIPFRVLFWFAWQDAKHAR